MLYKEKENMPAHMCMQHGQNYSKTLRLVLRHWQYLQSWSS